MTRLFLMLTICGGISFAQSDQDTGTNMACVERQEIPKYPPLAAAARISGRVATTVAIFPDGSIKGVSTKLLSGTTNARLLSPAVEEAVRASVYRKACGGKSVRLVFNFGFDDDPNKAFAFGYPNQFWIFVVPPVIQTEP